MLNNDQNSTVGFSYLKITFPLLTVQLFPSIDFFKKDLSLRFTLLDREK